MWLPAMCLSGVTHCWWHGWSRQQWQGKGKAIVGMGQGDRLEEAGERQKEVISLGASYILHMEHLHHVQPPQSVRFARGTLAPQVPLPIVITQAANLLPFRLRHFV